MNQKKLLTYAFLLVAFLFAMPTFAQVTDVKPADNEIWWGYYHDTDELLGLGSGEAERYDCAISTLGSSEDLTGRTIRAVRFVVQGVSTMRDVKLWLSLDLPNDATEADICCIDIPTADLKNGKPTEVLLPTPYTITGEGVCVGFSLTQTYIGTTEQAFPLLSTTHPDDVVGSLYMKSSKNFPNWSDFRGLEYGRLAIQLLIDGDYKKNAVTVEDFGDGITLSNDSVQVPVRMTNVGTRGITDFDYTISTNGIQEFTRHVALDEPFLGYDCPLTTMVTLIADPNYGRQNKTITITRVNGEPNEADSRYTQSKGTLITLESSAPHRTVYEEFTGTWSGGCPRGITGRELLQKACGDDAIWISVHSGTEVMAIDAYQNVFNRIGLTPSGFVNRVLRADPYYGSQMPRSGFGLDKDVARDQKAVAEASIEISQPQMDKTGHIQLSTDVRFNYSRNDAPYAIGYVLLCDGLKGDGSDWAQANSFPTWKNMGFYDTSDANLNYWASQPASLTNIEYNNVAIAAYGIDNGLKGSIKAPITMGEVQTYPFEIELGFNELAQNLYRLSVVALLFNTETGEIVNAAKQPVNVSEEFVGTSATITDFGKVLGIAGQNVNIPVVVENYGKQDITDIDFSVQLDGSAATVSHVKLDRVLAFGNKRTINVPMQAPTSAKDHGVTITVSNVNDSENEAMGRKTGTGTLRVLTSAPLHKTYVEEYTGTWCGFCPRGTLGLRLLEERHAGKFVCTAVHRNDPMEISDYSSVLANISGYPSSTINRSFSVDPYMGNSAKGFGLGLLVEEESAKLTEAAITLDVPTYDRESQNLVATATAHFHYNADSAPYAIGFILRADGLKGNSKEWLQHNYYYSYQGSTMYQDDADLQTIIQKGEWMNDPFNHVPIAAEGILTGIPRSIDAPISASEPQSFTHIFDLSSNPLVQDYDQLSIVALLFNTETGEIVNCEEAHAKDIVGISNIETLSNNNSVLYDLQGRRISRSMQSKGIYIMGGRKVLR